MQILEYEVKRYDLWKEDLKQKCLEFPRDTDKHRRKFVALAKKQEQLLRGKMGCFRPRLAH